MFFFLDVFLVWSDHQYLDYIHTVQRLNARQSRWASYFSWFNFTLTNRPRSKNTKSHALSQQFYIASSARDTILHVLMVRALYWDLRNIKHVSHVPAGCPVGRLFPFCTLPTGAAVGALLKTSSTWTQLCLDRGIVVAFSLGRCPTIYVATFSVCARSTVMSPGSTSMLWTLGW